jgi:hypothetical protein
MNTSITLIHLESILKGYLLMEDVLNKLTDSIRCHLEGDESNIWPHWTTKDYLDSAMSGASFALDAAVEDRDSVRDVQAWVCRAILDEQNAQIQAAIDAQEAEKEVKQKVQEKPSATKKKPSTKAKGKAKK